MELGSQNLHCDESGGLTKVPTLHGESGAVGGGAGDVGRRALVPSRVPSVGPLTAQ